MSRGLGYKPAFLRDPIHLKGSFFFFMDISLAKKPQFSGGGMSPFLHGVKDTFKMKNE